MRKNFQINSGRMVISDPTYKLNSVVNATIDNVKNGKWASMVNYSDDERIIESLAVFNVQSFSKDEKIFENLENLLKEANQLPNLFAVDSGKLGFFDLQGYNNDRRCNRLRRQSKNKIYHWNQFYSFCCDRTSTEEGWGTLPFGVVSTSGYGDGFYDVFGLKNSVGEYIFFVVDFNINNLF